MLLYCLDRAWTATTERIALSADTVLETIEIRDIAASDVRTGHVQRPPHVTLNIVVIVPKHIALPLRHRKLSSTNE
jgi:hypothetical protein